MYSIIDSLFILLIPFLAVSFFLLMERFVFNYTARQKGRGMSILSIQILNVILNIFLSSLILVPLVFYSSLLQIYSFANMNAPHYISLPLSFLFLDLVAYWHHRTHHQVPFLWRLHRLHHTDKEVDALTAFLHHPGEIITTFIVTIFFSVMFDVPLIVITSYALFVSIHAPFTHLHKLLPPRYDNFLKYVFVTPNYHLLHHSKNIEEGSSNYGLVFIFWDYLFGSYRAQGFKSLKLTKFGLPGHDKDDTVGLLNFLSHPFK